MLVLFQFTYLSLLVYPHFHDFYPFACQAYVFITNFHAGLKYHSPAGILLLYKNISFYATCPAVTQGFRF